MENEVEKGYIREMLNVAAFFLRRATKEMMALFPNSDQDLSTTGREAIFEAGEDEFDITKAARGHE